MKHNKKNAFTLIELIAVLVIMAIIALIATPLVMNIIRKARISADKRSIDAYGRSIELSIAGYLMDTGSFPTSIGELTIEYSGDEVVCTTTELNSDSSVYLAGCTVAGRSVEGYTYGSDKSPTYTAYTVGNQVTYNNVDYYAIKDSGAKESTVTLLKAEPLSVEEVNEYGGVGTVNNHVNRYTESSVGIARDVNGYGAMAYYTSETCGYPNGIYKPENCNNDYATSDIKYVVDAWKTAKAPAASEGRLILKEEIEIESREYKPCGPCEATLYDFVKYDWMHNSMYSYVTSTKYNGSSDKVWVVSSRGDIETSSSVYNFTVVRPVIVLPKSAISS